MSAGVPKTHRQHPYTNAYAVTPTPVFDKTRPVDVSRNRLLLISFTSTQHDACRHSQLIQEQEHYVPPDAKQGQSTPTAGLPGCAISVVSSSRLCSAIPANFKEHYWLGHQLLLRALC